MKLDSRERESGVSRVCECVRRQRQRRVACAHDRWCVQLWVPEQSAGRSRRLGQRWYEAMLRARRQRCVRARAGRSVGDGSATWSSRLVPAGVSVPVFNFGCRYVLATAAGE